MYYAYVQPTLKMAFVEKSKFEFDSKEDQHPFYFTCIFHSIWPIKSLKMEGNYLKDFLASETSQKKKKRETFGRRNICERTYYANKHKSDDAQKKGDSKKPPDV